MIDVIQWYVAVQLFGLAALPLALRLLGNLPDRGFAFARPIGILVAGYVLWQSAMLGALSNSRGTVALIVIVLGVVSWTFLRSEIVSLRELWRARRWVIVGTEVVFASGFLFWCLVRAYVPEISGTEKPMELAFLNGVLRSERFPPVDPWLAGYSISYYYFGYVIVGMITQLAGVASSIAFNLAIATLFGLTATGAWSLGANLVSAARSDHGDDEPRLRRSYLLGGALALLLVLFLANVEPVFETLNAHNALSAETKAWLNIKDLPRGYNSPYWHPSDTMDNWWWFRATRVVGDPESKLDYTINEFPFFSFLLGDMHPHVLALPFVMTALAFALNLVRSARTLASARRDPLFVVSVAVLFGGLSFLNAWDMLTYLFVLTGAFLIQRVVGTGEITRPLVREAALFGGGALLVSVVAYFDFYPFLRSQVSGIGFVPFRTFWHHFLIFWGPLYFLTVSFLGYALASSWRAPGEARDDWTRQNVVWLGVALVAAVSFLLDAPAVAFTIVPLVMAMAIAARTLSAAPVVAEQPVVTATRTRSRARAARAPTEHVEIAGGATPPLWAREHLFAVLLIGTASLLIFGTELVFIRDNFNNRMNTVFKLYYQAWALLAIGGAYGVFYVATRWIAPRPGDLPRLLWSGAAIALVVAGLIYPVGATLSRTRYFEGSPTLDGLAHYARVRPDDLALIAWFQDNVSGTPTIVEMHGGSYSQYGRIAAATGLPTLLGWEPHEYQWRGRIEEPGRRRPVIEKIYKSTSENEVKALLQTYGVTYVVVGQAERDLFAKEPGALEKFAKFMDVAYRAPGGATIYRVRGQ